VRLATDRELRIRFGTSAWECARRRFTWEQERDALRRLMCLEA
jgi:hypothetical protein